MPEVYRGNANIKSQNVQIQWTPERLKEYEKCANDPAYFIQTYMKIIHVDKGLVPFAMYDYQENLINHINDNRFSIVLASRQSGKSITVVGYILWYALFHSEKTVAVLANKGSTAKEMLGRIVTALENVPFFLQPGAKTVNKGNIEFENNSEIIAASTSASSIRGLSCVTGDTMICCADGDDVYYIPIMEVGKMPDKDSQIKYSVYKTTNLINGKVYIGYHKTTNIHDGYLGSGKLIKKAIEKYGPENFKKDILGVFETSAEAENFEQSIVNVEFVQENNNYNLAIGGNVRSMPGENNPFYGQKHSDEFKKKLSDTKTGVPSKNRYQIVHDDGTILWGYENACSYIGYDKTNHRHKILLEAGSPNGVISFVDTELQKSAVMYYIENKRKNQDNKNVLADNAQKRFAGVEKTTDHKQKISDSLTGHKKTVDWSNAINKNPEKIEKTRQKHLGMKRSDETKQKISEAKRGKIARNSGKKYFHNPRTGEGQFYTPENAPQGWVSGYYRQGQ